MSVSFSTSQMILCRSFFLPVYAAMRHGSSVLGFDFTRKSIMMDTMNTKIAISGVNGLVGSHLRALLSSQGITVVPISREFFATPDPSLLEDCDAVIHLAGAGISDHRWTESYKDLIRSSRIRGTSAVAKALGRCTQRPRVLVCASAIGFYGNRGDEILDETSTSGIGFLPQVARDWEAACEPARDVGVRVVNARFGVILSTMGGALAKMLPLFKLGLGGPLGSGKQWISWVALQDVIAAIQFVIEHEELHGPVNVVAPAPIRNADFVRTLGRVLHRPAFLSVPTFALKLVMGEMADELLLARQRVIPNVLQKSGFKFQFPEIEAALKSQCCHPEC